MLRSLLVFVLVSTGWADQASRLAGQARKAEKRGDDVEAFALYTRAAGLRPLASRYRLESERVRTRAAQGMVALGRLPQALALDPQNDYLRARLAEPQPVAETAPPQSEIDEAEQLAEPIQLRPRTLRRSFALRGHLHAQFEQVFRAYGIEVVFDSEFAAGSPARLELDGVDFREAATALMASAGAFIVPVHERVALVLKDTQQKRNEFEPMMAALLPIPLVMSVEEANEVGRAVQQALDVRRLAVDATRRQVLIRDTVAKVRLARAMYQELSRSRGEVHIQVELLAASSSALSNLGLTVPTTFPISSGSLALAELGRAGRLFGVAIGGGSFQADWRQSETQLLSSFSLRATDGMAASLHIGDKYPIINASFGPVVLNDQIRDLQNSGQYRQPFPSFNFEDLGLVMKLTPRVHDTREISLTIEAEFRLLTGESVNGVPVLSNRKISTAVRLKEGESSIVSGLVVAQSSRSASGLPLIGRFLGPHRWQNDQSELIISITPRLTGLPPADQFPTREFHYGTETRAAPSL